MTGAGDHVEMSNVTQRICFDRTPDGRFQLTTYLRNGDSWTPLFDARRAVVEGSCFNLEPTSCDVADNGPSRKAVLLRGVHRQPDYPWAARVELRADSPFIRFVITCRLPADLKIDSPQPTVALWMNQTTAPLTLDQGPLSQTGDAYRVPFNRGFPAAYLWDRGREAFVFFNMTPMTWFSPHGIHRFLDVRIKAQVQGGRIGLGLHPHSRSGDTIRAGPMVIDFCLFSRRREDKPTKFAALDTMMRACAPLHPADSQFPKNTLDGGEVSWEQFAQRAIRDSMIENATYAEVKKPWRDKPLDLVRYRDTMIVHPDWMKSDPKLLATQWNFSTVNHHLAPWILYARLHPSEKRMLEFARVKKDAVPRFYDPPSRMIRSFLPTIPPATPMEITWLNLMCYKQMLRIDEALAAGDYNPAIVGRMLMGAEGLIDYAHEVNYVFATYFNPLTRRPRPFVENPGLGTLREPWSVGSYSFVMMQSHLITGDRQFLDEARASLNALLHTMRYSESNTYYTRHYDEPMDMPPSDLTGNAYGAVAAYKLYQQGAGDSFRRTSHDFLNTLLRMTLWHDDRTDAVSRELRHAGLFYPFVGAACATPWETTEANLCMAWLLGHDLDGPLTMLLLKLSNLNRINSFYFYPATYGPHVRALNPKLRRDVGQYFPIEPLYQLESMGGSTGTEGTAQYMMGNAVWNWWMYEALAEPSDRAIMVLNVATLEDYEEALSGARRNLVVFNPTQGRRRFSLRVKGLSDGAGYTLALADAAGGRGTPTAYAAGRLEAGIPLDLAARGYVRVELRLADGDATLARIKTARDARRRIAHAYALLQRLASDESASGRRAQGLKDHFRAAMHAYVSRDYAAATQAAESILTRLGVQRSRRGH